MSSEPSHEQQTRISEHLECLKTLGRLRQALAEEEQWRKHGKPPWPVYGTTAPPWPNPAGPPPEWKPEQSRLGILCWT